MHSSNKKVEQPINISFEDILSIIDMVPEIVLILDCNGVVMCCNRYLSDFLGKKNDAVLTGKRIGAVFGCIHSGEDGEQCGMSEFCSRCGAHHSLSSSLNQFEDEQECRITTKTNATNLISYDFKVFARPILVNNTKASFLIMKDVSSDKRKLALERIFFHDIMNTAAGLKGFLELSMRSKNFEEAKKFIKQSNDIYDYMMEEIISQKQLLAAEDNRLVISKSILNSLSLLQEVVKPFSSKMGIVKRNIRIEPEACSVDFISDHSLIRRVLENLVKNAVEATKQSGIISLNAIRHENHIEFTVSNEGFIPKDIQLQIFKRSFSTKGADRGLGTYSIKLLTEKYLSGKVSFQTSQSGGTVFSVIYPMLL